MRNAPNVAAPNPRVRNAGSQCCHRMRRPAITTPATTLTRNSGPTDWLRTPLNHSMRWTAAETSSAAAPRTRSLIGPSYSLGDTVVWTPYPERRAGPLIGSTSSGIIPNRWPSAPCGARPLAARRVHPNGGVREAVRQPQGAQLDVGDDDR